MKRRWFGGQVSGLILLWFYVTLAEGKQYTSKPEKKLLDGGANLDTKGFYCLPLNPQLRGPNPNSPQLQTWALCMPLPKSPACERNRTPGLLTARRLFSESQQLPLTGSFSPALPPLDPEQMPGPWEAFDLQAVFSEGLGPILCFPASAGFPPYPLLPSGFS